MSTGATTLRSFIEAALSALSNDPNLSDHAITAHAELCAAVDCLDSSESAWRQDGTTYRLVEDAIEVPNA